VIKNIFNPLKKKKVFSGVLGHVLWVKWEEF